MSSVLDNKGQYPVEYLLTQAEFRAIAHGFSVFHKYASQGIVAHDSTFRAIACEGSVLLSADYGKLIKPPINGVFMPDKETVRIMSSISGADDVRVRQDAAGCTFCGEHVRATVPWQPLESSCGITLSKMDQLGTTLMGLDHRVLKKFLGKRSGAVELGIYGDQLEQIGVSRNEVYTFTAGMAEQLAQRTPDHVFKSQHAFRFLGGKPTIELGKVRDAWVVKVTSSLDIQVQFTVIEQLSAVSQ